LPFCHFNIQVSAGRLKAFGLRKKGMMAQPASLGEHLRNRRLTLGLRQGDVTGQIETVKQVYERWARDERELVVSGWPLIMNPWATTPTLKYPPPI
jgi:hypothetical protein